MKAEKGDILQHPAQAIVNTVNCKGALGAGLAKAFRQVMPKAYEQGYQKACQDGSMRPGRVRITKQPRPGKPGESVYVVDFPTKDDWRKPSSLSYVEEGLQDLVKQVQGMGIRSIAIPPLGCGLGGLPEDRVRELVEQAAGKMPETEVVWIDL